MYRIDVTEDGDHLIAFMNTVVNLRVPLSAGNS
jgi:hypothetical protein